MGRQSPGGDDLARSVVAGQFTGTGTSAAFDVPGRQGAAFNLSLWGTFSASLRLLRSFDGGTTKLPCSSDLAGTVPSFTGPITITVGEPESGVLYYLECTAYTSGTVNYRLSR